MGITVLFIRKIASVSKQFVKLVHIYLAILLLVLVPHLIRNIYLDGSCPSDRCPIRIKFIPSLFLLMAGTFVTHNFKVELCCWGHRFCDWRLQGASVYVQAMLVIRLGRPINHVLLVIHLHMPVLRNHVLLIVLG